MKSVNCVILSSVLWLGGCANLPDIGLGTDSTGESGAGAATAATTRPAQADDAAIITAVKTALQQDDMLGGTAIDVTANDGVVTLRGQVADAFAYNRAISVASRVQGVKRPVRAVELVYPQ